MLAIKPQFSLKDARHYFKEHLTVGDYYTEGQHVPGHWFGQAAEDLGLTGVTGMDEFVRLCENIHPQTGEKLTPRLNTTRTEIGRDGQEHESSNRRVFYDFTFSPAKSVSIAALVGDDAWMVEAHAHAVTEALRQLQSFAATRVRKNGECTDRLTGNIVAAVCLRRPLLSRKSTHESGIRVSRNRQPVCRLISNDTCIHSGSSLNAS
jgi:conjugative relaxase-like TrwC/TraI family protein